MSKSVRKQRRQPLGQDAAMRLKTKMAELKLEARNHPETHPLNKNFYTEVKRILENERFELPESDLQSWWNSQVSATRKKYASGQTSTPMCIKIFEAIGEEDTARTWQKRDRDQSAGNLLWRKTTLNFIDHDRGVPKSGEAKFFKQLENLMKSKDILLPPNGCHEFWNEMVSTVLGRARKKQFPPTDEDCLILKYSDNDEKLSAWKAHFKSADKENLPSHSKKYRTSRSPSRSSRSLSRNSRERSNRRNRGRTHSRGRSSEKRSRRSRSRSGKHSDRHSRRRSRSSSRYDKRSRRMTRSRSRSSRIRSDHRSSRKTRSSSRNRSRRTSPSRSRSAEKYTSSYKTRKKNSASPRRSLSSVSSRSQRPRSRTPRNAFQELNTDLIFSHYSGKKSRVSKAGVDSQKTDYTSRQSYNNSARKRTVEEEVDDLMQDYDNDCEEEDCDDEDDEYDDDKHAGVPSGCDYEIKDMTKRLKVTRQNIVDAAESGMRVNRCVIDVNKLLLDMGAALVDLVSK